MQPRQRVLARPRRRPAQHGSPGRRVLDGRCDGEMRRHEVIVRAEGAARHGVRSPSVPGQRCRAGEVRTRGGRPLSPDSTDRGDVDSRPGRDGTERLGPQRGLVLALAASRRRGRSACPEPRGREAASGCSSRPRRSRSPRHHAHRPRERHAVVVTTERLGGLLALYAASPMVVIWPLAHVDRSTRRMITKLLEAAGLMLALRLLRVPSGSDETLRAVREGAGP